MTELRTLLRLVGISLPRRGVLPGIVVAGLVASVVQGIGIGLFVPLLEEFSARPDVTSGGNQLGVWLSGWFDGFPAETRRWWIAGAILVCAVAQAGLSYGNLLLSAWATTGLVHGLRTRLYSRALTFGQTYFDRTENGRVVNALTTEVYYASDAFEHLIRATIAVCTIVVYTALLLLLAPVVTAGVVVAMAIIWGIVAWCTRRARGLGRKVTQANADLSQQVVESVDGIADIQAYGRESVMRDRFDAASRHESRLWRRLGALSGATHPIYEILVAVLFVGLLLTSVDLVGGLASTVVFVLVLYRLQPVVRRLHNARVQLLALGGALREISGMLDVSDKSVPESGDARIGALRDIVFDRVSARYAGTTTDALHDVSLRLPARTTTALVGPSGSGKSTALALLVRFYEPRVGSIRVDGVELRDLHLGTWRSRVAFVSQDPFLFHASVAENIRVGRADATDAEVESAARMAAAHDFVVTLPDGYDTLVGDRGATLSGGQRQRIALARAFVRGADVILLDEATNALDSEAEACVLDALERVSPRPTVVLIAHRVATAQRADRFVYFDGGRVRREGNIASVDMNELMASTHKNA